MRPGSAPLRHCSQAHPFVPTPPSTPPTPHVREQITGANLALRTSDPSVYIGTSLCTSITVVNTGTLQCTAPVMVIGRYPVVVSLSDQNSSANATLDRLCVEGSFGNPGEPCKPCPLVRAPWDGVCRAGNRVWGVHCVCVGCVCVLPPQGWMVAFPGGVHA